ncbi:hypothetical protein L3Q72_14930 [Vibrio sp. JC009]|uniref:hypothetical protein n=1 Tax=Vibrio sp. JC009 TaxID=2912314 RepID=UPI0023B07AE4|nr:hypothetical protein [Vibrio sp. JC009]WED24177.1 hypothetical protein L3Q72_14930 [Vibrio sp. JC009]
MIINKIGGPHNEYDVTETIRKLREEIESLNGLPFVELVDARDLKGITPEGYEVVEEYYRWIIEKGIVAKAYVTNNPILAEIGKKRVPEAEQTNIRLFSDINEAKHWLLQELQKHESSKQRA